MRRESVLNTSFFVLFFVFVFVDDDDFAPRRRTNEEEEDKEKEVVKLLVLMILFRLTKVPWWCAPFIIVVSLVDATTKCGKTVVWGKTNPISPLQSQTHLTSRSTENA